MGQAPLVFHPFNHSCDRHQPTMSCFMVAVRHFVVMGDDREVKKSEYPSPAPEPCMRYSKSSVSLSVYVCIKDHQHAYRPHLSYTYVCATRFRNNSLSIRDCHRSTISSNRYRSASIQNIIPNKIAERKLILLSYATYFASLGYPQIPSPFQKS
jgi:hypothetical protein